MKEATAEVVRAKRIELLDDDGIVRAVLCTETDDSDFEMVKLGLNGPNGKERLTLYCDGVGAGVELWERGQVIGSLWARRDGTAELLLSDKDGEPVVAVKNHGSPLVVGHSGPLLLRALRVLRVRRAFKTGDE